MASPLRIPQIIYSQPPEDYQSFTHSIEGEILIHFPGWMDPEYRDCEPRSPDGVDLGDYPMAILTRGASRKDPPTAISEKVHIIYAQNPPRRPSLPTSQCNQSWRLSFESDDSSSSEADSSGSLTPTSSASSAFPSPKLSCEALVIVNSAEERQLRRRAHVRRSSSENQPANRKVGATSPPPPVSPPARNPSLPSQPCDPVLPASSPNSSRCEDSPIASSPLKKSNPARASICPDRASWINSPDSMPIDWSFLELTLGCAKDDPFAPSLPPLSKVAKRAEISKQSASCRSRSKSIQRQPNLEVLKEVAEEEENKASLTVSRDIKKSRRRTPLVGATFVVSNLSFSP